MSCCLCLSEMEALIPVFDEQGLDTRGVAADITKFIGLEIKSNSNGVVSICILCWAHLDNFRTFCRLIQGKQKEFKLKIKKDIEDEENAGTCEVANKFEVEMFVSESSFKVKAEDDVLQEKEPSTKRTRKTSKRSNEDSSPNKIKNSKEDKQEIAADNKLTPPIRKVGRPSKKNVNTYNDEDRLIDSHMTMICNECQMEQETFYDLKQHFKKVHNRDGYAVCCNQHIYKKGILLEHIRIPVFI